MKDQIATRYVAALVEGASIDDLQAFESILRALDETLNDEKVKAMIFSPYMDKAGKLAILLDAVKTAKSDKLNNLLKLLVEKRRLDVIGSMSDVLRLMIAQERKVYQGKVSSNSDFDAKSIKAFEEKLSNKTGASISLNFEKNAYNGVKVEVEDLGLELSFSKDQLRQQMIQHILKTI